MLESHATLVPVDSQDFKEHIFSGEIVYLRMHGRGKRWCSYLYSDDELQDILKRLDSADPEEAYVFFNNDQAMIGNTRRLPEFRN